MKALKEKMEDLKEYRKTVERVEQEFLVLSKRAACAFRGQEYFEERGSYDGRESFEERGSDDGGETNDSDSD